MENIHTMMQIVQSLDMLWNRVVVFFLFFFKNWDISPPPPHMYMHTHPRGYRKIFQ